MQTKYDKARLYFYSIKKNISFLRLVEKFGFNQKLASFYISELKKTGDIIDTGKIMPGTARTRIYQICGNKKVNVSYEVKSYINGLEKDELFSLEGVSDCLFFNRQNMYYIFNVMKRTGSIAFVKLDPETRAKMYKRVNVMSVETGKYRNDRGYKKSIISKADMTKQAWHKFSYAGNNQRMTEIER